MSEQFSNVFESDPLFEGVLGERVPQLVRPPDTLATEDRPEPAGRVALAVAIDKYEALAPVFRALLQDRESNWIEVKSPDPSTVMCFVLAKHADGTLHVYVFPLEIASLTRPAPSLDNEPQDSPRLSWQVRERFYKVVWSHVTGLLRRLWQAGEKRHPI